MDEIRTWIQGYFVDQPQYRRWAQKEKDRANEQEKLNVRPSPTGNAVCRCFRAEDAKWISDRLNFASKIEKRLGEICDALVG